MSKFVLIWWIVNSSGSSIATGSAEFQSYQSCRAALAALIQQYRYADRANGVCSQY